MRKFNYESPEISIIELDQVDILTLSPGFDGGDVGGSDDDSILDW